MNLQVGVKCFLVNEESKILLLYRSDKYPEVNNKWDIPGGRIEIGSSLMDNLAREVKEETGLTFTDTPQLIAAQDILKEDKHVVRLSYIAHTTGEPVLDGEEHTEYRWLTPQEALELQGLDRYPREVLEAGKVMI